MAEYHTYAYDADDEIPVIVEYEFTPPRRATYWEPAEGGVEVVGITCARPLTKKEIDQIEQNCIDTVWEAYYEKVRGGL